MSKEIITEVIHYINEKIEHHHRMIDLLSQKHQNGAVRVAVFEIRAKVEALKDVLKLIEQEKDRE